MKYIEKIFDNGIVRATLMLGVISILFVYRIPITSALAYPPPDITGTVTPSSAVDQSMVASGTARGAIVAGTTHCSDGGHNEDSVPFVDAEYFIDNSSYTGYDGTNNSGGGTTFSLPTTALGESQGCGGDAATAYEYLFSAISINTSALSNGSHTITFVAETALANDYRTTQIVSSGVVSFTVQHAVPGTVAVTADRTAYWEVTGTKTGASFSGSGTSGGPYTAPADTYTMIDPATESSPYGFIDNPTFSLNGSPNIFASLVKTAEADSCYDGWVCSLSAGGTVNYVLTTTTCNISVETNVNGNIASISSLPMTFSGPLNSYSYSSTPQTPYSIADSSGSTFTLTLPSTGSWSGYVTDYVGTDVTSSDGTVTSYPATTLSPNPACVAGGSLAFVAKYLTRASMLVQ